MLPERTDSNWICTFTGRQFWPLNPKIEDLDLEDIAHALSNLCRFTGHCRHFYSVAQHCVLASQWCAVTDAKWCLMHDAAEAYINDVAKPVKACLPLMSEAEEAILACVAARWGLRYPWPKTVKHVDLMMLATERRDILAPCRRKWNSIEGVHPFPDPIEPVPPLTAEAMFLTRFGELFGRDY